MTLLARTAAVAAALILLLVPAAAEIVRTSTDKTVSEAMGDLEAAVRDGGATVFARVDHGAGAAGAGLELADSQLLVFGNPKVGTLPQQADIEVGLVLPMRVLIYRGRAGTVIAYVPPKELFAGFDVPPDADYVDRIDTVLKTLVDRAAR